MSDLIAPAMSDNEALRRIVALLDAFISHIIGEYTSLVGENTLTVTTATTAIRGADDEALKTVVTNVSNKVIQVYEDGNLVARLNEDQTWVSDLSGRLAITAKTLNGEGSVAVATYRL